MKYDSKTEENIRLSEHRSAIDKSLEHTWDVGHYWGKHSVCVNLIYKGKQYHRHDYFGIFPRWIRIGWYMWRLEKEAKIFEEYESRLDGSYSLKCYSGMY